MRIQVQKQRKLVDVIYDNLLLNIRQYVFNEIIRHIVKNANNNNYYYYNFKHFYTYLKYLGVKDRDIYKLWSDLIREVSKLRDGFDIKFTKYYIRVVKKKF